MELNIPIAMLLIIASISAQNVLKKGYLNKVEKGGIFTYSLFSVLTACLLFGAVWCFGSGSAMLDLAAIIPYAVMFAVGYGTAVVFTMIALRCGSLSLTSLVVSFSLIIPTMYGIVFDNDPISIPMIIGLILLAVSLVLINAQKGEVKISFGWTIAVTLACIGNGLCSTVQISEEGISPGSGYGRKVERIDSETIGVPVIAIGIPMAVNSATLAVELFKKMGISKLGADITDTLEKRRGYLVTPTNIELTVRQASFLIAKSIDLAIQTL